MYKIIGTLILFSISTIGFAQTKVETKKTDATPQKTAVKKVIKTPKKEKLESSKKKGSTSNKTFVVTSKMKPKPIEAERPLPKPFKPTPIKEPKKN
jgi:hypothetical protein